MTINSIMLKLLGTFYENHKRSFVIAGLDKVYSKAILERYLVTCRRRVVSSESSIPLVPHLGYIKYNDIDISSRKITITDIAGKQVEMKDIGIISFMYIDSDKFYTIDNGVLDDEGFNALSEEWSNNESFPVVYHKNVDMKTVSISSLSSEEDSFAMPILRLMAFMTTYNHSSIQDMYVLINVMLGAKYYIGNGTVEEIFKDNILISGEAFQIKGKIIVTEGQELSGITLLEEVVQVEINSESSSAAKKMEALAENAESEESKRFIQLLGGNLSKNLIVANIPIETITTVDKEIISAISSLVSTTSNYSYSSETVAGTDEVHDISMNDSLDPTIDNSESITVSIVSGLVLNIDTSLELGIKEDFEAIIDDDSEQQIPDSDGKYVSNPLEDVATVSVSEEAINLISSFEDMMVDDDDNESGATLERHEFVDADDDLVFTLKEKDDLTFGDTILDGVFKDGIILGDESIGSGDNLDTILNSDNADQMMSNAYISVHKETEEVLSVMDSLSATTSISTNDNIGILSASQHQIVEYSIPELELSTRVLMTQTDIASMEKTGISLNSLYAYEDHIYSSDMAGLDIARTDNIAVEDIITVNTNTTVDE